MLKLLETTKNVLGKHQMPCDAVDKLEANMREAKAGIDELLGHTESTLYRTRIPIVKTEAEVRTMYPQTYAFIAHILKEAIVAGAPIDLPSIALVGNNVKVKGQEMRLSKVLAKHMAGKEEGLKWAIRELGIKLPEQFLPKLGDITKSDRVVWLSTNILDFLTASDNAAFRSCHSFDGQHFNGNIAYCRDKMTILTYVSDNKPKETQHEIYKLGRSWLFLADGKIAHPKSYGAYNAQERELARKFIIDKLAEKAGISPEEYGIASKSYNSNYYTKEKPSDVSSDGMAGYFDANDVEIAYNKTKTFVMPKLEFAAAMCLMCGDTTDHQRRGVCSEHDGKVKFLCSACGQRHLVDRGSYEVGGNLYCPTCYSARFASCSYCSNHFEKAEMVTIDGCRVCPHCLKENYENCSDCGKQHRKDNMSNLAGVKGKLCGKCVYSYVMCGCCKQYKKESDVTYHKYVGRVCSGCEKEVAFTCAGCGELHSNDTRTEGFGDLCVSCVAKLQGKTVELKPKPKYSGLPEGWEDFEEIIG